MQKCVVHTKLDIHVFLTVTFVDTSTGALHVADGIIRPLFSNSALTWLIRYIYLFEICHSYIVDNTISLGKGYLIRLVPGSGWLNELGRWIWI